MKNGKCASKSMKERNINIYLINVQNMQCSVPTQRIEKAMYMKQTIINLYLALCCLSANLQFELLAVILFHMDFVFLCLCCWSLVVIILVLCCIFLF